MKMRCRPAGLIKSLAIAAAFALIGVHPVAQSSSSLTVRVSETAGIRRNNYPAGARVHFQRGALADATHVRLLSDGKEIPVQSGIESSYPDGSVQWLTLDFNVSLGPRETAALVLEYGADVKQAIAGRGLTVTEGADGIQIGSVRLSLTGAPLMTSVKYRREDIGSGANGFSLTDVDGNTHDATTAEQVKVHVLKRGPFIVLVEYSGRLPLGGGYAVGYLTSVEMPNSKTWVKTTTTVDDPEKRVREVSFHTPLSLGAQPWTWDFGTGSWSYGVLRGSTESVTLTQSVGPAQARKWEIHAGTKGTEQPYEVSGGRRPPVAEGWGHIQDQSEAVAFAIPDFGVQAGTYSTTLAGDGQLSFRWAPARPIPHLTLTVYEHFVATPVPVGAVTSPASMLSPLVVSVSPR
jgi:hypothetical protein